MRINYLTQRSLLVSHPPQLSRLHSRGRFVHRRSSLGSYVVALLIRFSPPCFMSSNVAFIVSPTAQAIGSPLLQPATESSGWVLDCSVPTVSDELGRGDGGSSATFF